MKWVWKFRWMWSPCQQKPSRVTIAGKCIVVVAFKPVIRVMSAGWRTTPDAALIDDWPENASVSNKKTSRWLFDLFDLTWKSTLLISSATDSSMKCRILWKMRQVYGCVSNQSPSLTMFGYFSSVQRDSRRTSWWDWHAVVLLVGRQF